MNLWKTNRALIPCLTIYSVITIYTGMRAHSYVIWLNELSIPWAVILTIWAFRRTFQFGEASIICLTAYAVCHAFGAESMIVATPAGEVIGALLGSERNMYDRLLHFLFGALFAYPSFEVVKWTLGLSGHRRTVVAGLLIVSLATGYELLEWKTAMFMQKADADNFLGFQGDPWDTQWDLFSSIIGFCTATAVVMVWQAFSSSATKAERSDNAG